MKVRYVMKIHETLGNVTEYGQTYEIMRMVAKTDAEKRFGDFPFIAIHESYDRKTTLNGLQTMISRTYDELIECVKIDAARRKFMNDNPDADFMEVVKYIAGLEV